MNEKPTRVPPRILCDYLLSQGRSAIQLPQAAELMGITEQGASDAFMGLRSKAAFFSPARGLYIAIPPQYRSWKVVPAMDFIDAMMQALDRKYYVALLSAAELHGAAHQRPQVFQVMVDKQLAPRDLGRVQIKFYSRKHLSEIPVTKINSASGQVRISTPAATALDLATRSIDAGGLGNVATVLFELFEEKKISTKEVIATSAHFPDASLRRLGWLLDLVDAPLDRDQLANHLARRPATRAGSLLDSHGSRTGHTNKRWSLVINTNVEPDL